MMQLKKALFNYCLHQVEEQIKALENTLQSYRNDLHSETKSSAGDKHETGRAMLQLEMEKVGKQHLEVLEKEKTLQKIDVTVSSKVVCLGTLVFTDKINYFLSVSLGKITIEDEIFFAISPSSPIGKLMLGKSKGEKVSFNGNQITIQKIV